MNLKNELQAVVQHMGENAPEEVLQAIGGEIEKMVASDVASKALKRGDAAIRFSLPNQNNEIIFLDDLLKHGPVVLSFNRGGWCPFCNLEFKALQEALPAIDSYGANLLMVLPQLSGKSQQSIAQHNLGFNLLRDENCEVAEKYGLAFTLAEALRPIHLEFDMNIPEFNGDDSYRLPMPATYVIDSDGQIQYGYVNPNWMERSEPDEILKVLAAAAGKVG